MNRKDIKGQEPNKFGLFLSIADDSGCFAGDFPVSLL
jgi:hypothetical protein